MLNYEKQNSSPVKADDYANALVHLAYYRDDKKFTLLFGFVELFPIECPNREGEGEGGATLQLRAFGDRCYLYVWHYPMSFEKALRWYQLCREGKVVFPDLFETDEQLDPLGISEFAEEPEWPHLITSIKLPFHSLGAVRAPSYTAN